jgi:hypothetical protein
MLKLFVLRVVVKGGLLGWPHAIELAEESALAERSIAKTSVACLRIPAGKA